MVRYEYLDLTVREKKIHPDGIFVNEKELAKRYIQTQKFKKKIEKCIFCGANTKETFFDKWGITYSLCLAEWSVGLGVLPEEKHIKAYFRKSPLAQFRSSKEYQDTVAKGRHYVWESLIEWIEGRVDRYLGNEKYKVADWGSKFVGWIQVLQEAKFVLHFDVIDPLPPILGGPENDDFLDIICLIDVLQRQTDPFNFLSNVWKKLSSGGILVLTCRSGSGFDILTLGKNTETVFPLDHISLPSPEGLKILLEKVGFDILELTTPGMLDVGYVQKSIHSISKEQYFQRYIFSQADEQTLERLQGFLQQNNLSSHIRCVARKK